MMPNMESYYGPPASTILAPSTIPIRKVVDSSLKDRNIRTRKSGLPDQTGGKN